MTERTLLIFAKSPRIGRAKTRLAADIGPTHALRLNRYCHSRAVRAAKGPWRSVLNIAPDTDIDAAHGGLWPHTVLRRKQGGGDLGMRLCSAFQQAPPGPVIVIGTDAPDISAALIHKAFQRLNGCDAVAGPADDGGFWLFGASQRLRRHALAFNPVRWSSAHALADLAATLPVGARMARIDRLIDLDDAAALKAWREMRRAPSSSWNPV